MTFSVEAIFMEASFDHVTSSLVSVPEPKRLLHESKEYRSDI